MDISSAKEELGEEIVPAAKDPANLPIVEEMMKSGIFIGKKSSKTHPKMKPFIFGVRNGISLIDLEETLKRLNAATDFIKNKLTAKDNILMAGTTPPAKKSIEETAMRLHFPFVTERWLGGTLTNFKTLSKRIAHFKKLKNDKEAGRLDKYTKKERLEFDREIQKMSVMFGGLEGMEGLPAALFVVDVTAHMTAIREARLLKIPIIAVINTDADPDLVQYPIPASDKNKLSIDWVLSHIEKAVEEKRSAVGGINS